MKLWNDVLDKRPAKSTFVERAREAVDDKLIADIVADNRSGPSAPASLAKPVERSKMPGWIEPRKLEHPLDSWAGRMVDADLARRK